MTQMRKETDPKRDRREGITRAVAARRFNILRRKEEMARVTGLEPATSGVTGRHSNRLSYTRAFYQYVRDRFKKWRE